ncbi:hypothetical protein ACODT5_09890 [Streptomyces sp. 5.8]|uniref:hypothetical protein n=1 Tax=Streptomyces sp. 5.8 TaxID=3406571 RepID=UPI003BB54A80
MGLVRFWAEDNATAREFPGAEWTVDEEAQLYGVVAGEEDAQAWADYLGIDLARISGCHRARANALWAVHR